MLDGHSPNKLLLDFPVLVSQNVSLGHNLPPRNFGQQISAWVRYPPGSFTNNLDLSFDGAASPSVFTEIVEGQLFRHLDDSPGGIEHVQKQGQIFLVRLHDK